MVLTAVLTFASSIVGYFVGNRRTQAETDKIVIENVKEILAVYSDVIDDLKIEIRELKEKIDEYERLVSKLTREINTLRNEMKQRKSQPQKSEKSVSDRP